MGYGTGVLRSYFAIYLLRGLSVGIAGTGSLFIALNTGVSQSFLIAARGFGMIVGPMLLSRAIGKMAWNGESQYAAAFALALKGLCDFVVGRASDHLTIYVSFFVIGVAMALLDTLLIILVTSAVKENRGSLLSTYDACYGIGGMVAPLLTVAMPNRVWDVLALIDFMLAAIMFGKRLLQGKPHNWKVKVRGADNTGDIAISGPSCPGRVISAGIAFTVLSQLGGTAVSAWGFTFGVRTLKLSDFTAALVPSVFYFSATVTRFVVASAARLMMPSAVIHFSVLFVIVGALPFRLLSAHVALTDGISQLCLFAILCCFALMGAGYCPHYSFMLISMARHGHLDARLNGLYATSSSLGIALGLWLPSCISLANLEVLCALGLFAIVNSRTQDFPWKGSLLAVPVSPVGCA